MQRIVAVLCVIDVLAASGYWVYATYFRDLREAKRLTSTSAIQRQRATPQAQEAILASRMRRP